ncbi:hypothetical protein HMI55_000014 [Coelomomyces lativittatus]|nr:hypothetical protein HMI55_000014 [Coelomomyces lativittatus]
MKVKSVLAGSASKLTNKKEEPSPNDSMPVQESQSMHRQNSSSTTQSLESDTSDDKQSYESKDSFVSFLRKILGKDVDSLRVSIPLFLLEPVSNLQYLSELEFVEELVHAGDKTDELERFLNVLRFIFSSWKKALKRSKKPLNPILGETIQVHYQSKSKEGSPPVYLIGEQISHHPPMSAFYVTCPEKNVDLTTIFDVKAKFDGTCLSLSNLSVTDIYLHDHKEVYHIEFPNAIITGILTMQINLLWRGTCTLSCKKTNLKAKITFKDQVPFF